LDECWIENDVGLIGAEVGEHIDDWVEDVEQNLENTHFPSSGYYKCILYCSLNLTNKAIYSYILLVYKSVGLYPI